MKSSFLHTIKDNKKSIIKSFLLLIPLIIYGIYKNGVLLYLRKDISFIEIFKPLYFIIIALLINGMIEFLHKRKFCIDYSYLYVTITAMFLMPNTNYLVYIILLLAGILILKVLGKGLPLSKIAFLHLLIVMGMFIIGKYSYMNIAEAKDVYSLTLLDYFVGRNIGGISSSSSLIGVIVFSILAFTTTYKKRIPMLAYLTYALCTLVLFLTLKVDYHMFFSSTVILGFVLLTIENEASPYTPKGEIIYAIMLGIFTSILTMLFPYEGVFMTILFLSFLKNVFDKIGRKFL